VKSLLCGSDTLKEYIQKKINQARKDEFLMKLQLIDNVVCTSVMLSVNEVMNAISQLKMGKATGPDGVSVEAFKFGGHRLAVYLALLFNVCMWCGYVPRDLLCSVFVPLIKKTEQVIYRMPAITEL